MKKQFKETNVPILTIDPNTALFSYRKVREMFGWRENTSLRNAVKRGDLIRVRIGKGSAFKITADSAMRYHLSIREEAATRKQFDIADADWNIAKANKRKEEIAAIKQNPEGLTPAQQNAAYIEEQRTLPVIWVGNQGFQGIDDQGRDAESRALAYQARLDEAKRPKKYHALQVRGI